MVLVVLWVSLVVLVVLLVMLGVPLVVLGLQLLVLVVLLVMLGMPLVMLGSQLVVLAVLPRHLQRAATTAPSPRRASAELHPRGGPRVRGQTRPCPKPTPWLQVKPGG